MEIGMEMIDDCMTKGTFGEDERRPAGFGIESGVSGKVRDGSGSGSVAQSCIGTVRDGSGLVGIGSEGVGMFRSITVSPL